MTAMASKPTYRFGRFEVDLARSELRKDGRPVPIQPKPFLLLTHLLKHGGRLVTTRQLVDLLWPDVHVTSASLEQAISRLRKALGEGSRTVGFVETVARRGYRFRARVASESRQAVLMYGHGRVALPAGESLLGRDEESIVPIDSRSVSRRHARVIVTPDGAELEDLGSKNGTFVGKRRIAQSVQLFDGDEIRLGSVPLQFRYIGDESTVTDAADTTG